MKAIISHDIDHITVWEHLFKDTIIPKHLARMHIELVRGKISLREYTLRWTEFFKNKWQNIDELITFNNINGIPSSFFIAVNNGVGLSYNHESCLLWLEQMKNRHCELGLHGIAYKDSASMKSEYELFKRFSQLDHFGIRMHYVRNTESTFLSMNECGYVYDSTEHAFKDPYKIGNMWEFPFQIMDGWIIEGNKRYQSLDLDRSKEKTKVLINTALEKNLSYLGIDFHDRYFSHSYETWLAWYMWLIDYLRSNGISFVNFHTAISELENTHTKP